MTNQKLYATPSTLTGKPVQLTDLLEFDPTDN